MGLFLHVISKYSSLYTLTPSLVNTDIFPSSDVFPTIIKDVGKSSNVSACTALGDNCLRGNLVTYLHLLAPEFSTVTLFLKVSELVDLFLCGLPHSHNFRLILNLM